MNKVSILSVVFGLILGGCCNEDFITPGLDYDFREGAIDVTDLLDADDCSADAAYTTEGATPDGETSTCGGDPVSNRWFKFIAPANGEIWLYVNIGGTQGTQTETIVVLWDTDGTTELDCASYYDPNDNVYLSYNPLTPGETYYISVDATSDTVGTFTLCLSDTD